MLVNEETALSGSTVKRLKDFGICMAEAVERVDIVGKCGML
jgi:hypothetical protein